MKALINYFTWKGRTKKIAEAIAGSLTNYEVSFYPIEFSGGLRKLVKLSQGEFSRVEKDLQVLDAKDFDLILIGMPTYGSKPPMVFEEIINRMSNLSESEVVIFTTAFASGEATIQVMKSFLDTKGIKVKDEQFFNGFRFNVKPAIEFGKKLNNLKE
ncbi:MAG: flavodoxin family protein [Candidatus Thorarchaeota archaeon]